MGQEPNKPEGGFDLLPLVFFVTFVLLMAGVGFTRQVSHHRPAPMGQPMPMAVHVEDKPEVPVEVASHDRDQAVDPSPEIIAQPEPVEAEEAEKPEKPPRKPREGLMDYGYEQPYPYLEAIPEQLWRGIESGVFYEDYIEQAIRNAPEGGQNLQKVATRVFLTLDLNLDGMISKDEYDVAFKVFGLKELQGRLESVVVDLDLDADGVLSQKELREARKASKDPAVDIALHDEYRRMDSDQNGKISSKEISDEIRRLLDYEKGKSLSSSKIKIPATCGFGEDLKLPEGTVVYGVGGYGNGMTLDFPIEQSDHKTLLVDLVVNETSHPVALILGQYEPTVWHIRRTPETKIVAVFLVGFHRQVASGLEQDVALKTSMFKQEEKGSCGYVPFWNEDRANLDLISIQVYGQRAQFYGAVAQDGFTVVGKENFNRASLVQSGLNPPESYKLVGVPLAGRLGIQEAFDQGYIRPATATDQMAWVEKITDYAPDDPAAAEFLRKIEEDPGGQYMQMIWGDAYVVVRDDFTYPPGLHGANSGIFIIPDGVKRPKGDPGHSAVFDFKTMRCYGAQCM